MAGGAIQIIYIVIRIFFADSSSETAFVLIGLVIEMSFMMGFKNLHHRPRPFWDNYYVGNPGDGNGVFPADCISQFGNPSGHSIFAGYFSMYIFFAYIYASKK